MSPETTTRSMKLMTTPAAKAICLTAATTLLALSTTGIAHAAGPTADTIVNIKADDSQLSITAPLKVDMTVMADGKMVGPSPESLQIKNGSVFGVRVANVKVTPAAGYNITTDTNFASAQDEDTLWMGIAPDSKTKIQAGSHLQNAAPANATEWNMTAIGGNNPDLDLKFDGEMKNITNLTTAPAKVYDITWTFTAGNI